MKHKQQRTQPVFFVCVIVVCLLVFMSQQIAKASRTSGMFKETCEHNSYQWKLSSLNCQLCELLKNYLVWHANLSNCHILNRIIPYNEIGFFLKNFLGSIQRDFFVIKYHKERKWLEISKQRGATRLASTVLEVSATLETETHKP